MPLMLRSVHLPMSEHIANVLAQSADIDQLVIIGPDDPDLVAEAVGPHGRNILRGTNCSVLVLCVFIAELGNCHGPLNDARRRLPRSRGFAPPRQSCGRWFVHH